MDVTSQPRAEAALHILLPEVRVCELDILCMCFGGGACALCAYRESHCHHKRQSSFWLPKPGMP